MRDLVGLDRAERAAWPGTPSAIAPLGTSMPLGTTAPAPTSAPVRTSARCNTIEPVPIERAVLDDAALEVREVADRAVGADDRLELAGAVQHRAVLHRRARADDDAALVAAQHRLRPHRDAGPDHDVADDRAFGMHEGFRVDLRARCHRGHTGPWRGK